MDDFVFCLDKVRNLPVVVDLDYLHRAIQAGNIDQIRSRVPLNSQDWFMEKNLGDFSLMVLIVVVNLAVVGLMHVELVNSEVAVPAAGRENIISFLTNLEWAPRPFDALQRINWILLWRVYRNVSDGRHVWGLQETRGHAVLLLVIHCWIGNLIFLFIKYLQGF